MYTPAAYEHMLEILENLAQERGISLRQMAEVIGIEEERLKSRMLNCGWPDTNRNGLSLLERKRIADYLGLEWAYVNTLHKQCTHLDLRLLRPS